MMPEMLNLNRIGIDRDIGGICTKAVESLT